MKELLNLIKELGLKKSAAKILEKAVAEQLIYAGDLYAALPFAWTRKQKSSAVLLLCSALEQKGVLLTNKEKPEPDFSILDHPPFCFQCAQTEEIELVKNIFGQPEKKDWNDQIFTDDEIIFIAAGGLSLEKVDCEGRVKKISYFKKGEFFLPTDSLSASVITTSAYFWKLPRKKLNCLPPPLKEAVIDRLKERIFATRLLLALAEPTAKTRIQLVGEWLDELYATDEIFTSSSEQRAAFTHLTRETHDRPKQQPTRSKETP